MDREIEKTTDEESYEWGVSCLYSDKSTRFRRKGEFVEKEAWVEILLRRIAVVKGIFGSPPASQQGDRRRIYFT